MLKISSILMPVDFSERCLGMTHYARAIAEKYGAEITLLHIVNPVFLTPDTGMAPPAIVAVPPWLIEEKGKLLEDFASKELAGLAVRRAVYEGIPEMQIVETAQSEEGQLVIMPTHGYGVFRRFLIGSVTAKVLDDLTGPVLTGVHMEKHAHDIEEQFSTIACAIDLKDTSAGTLRYAVQLASDFDAKLGVIHVEARENSRTANDADLQPQLEELVAGELADGKVKFEPGRLISCVQSGEVAPTICDFAKSIDAKLLVIGREHAELSGVKAGGRLRSHAYSIIRQSVCPVWSL